MVVRGFSLVNPKTYKQLKFHVIMPKRGYMKHTLIIVLFALVSCGKGGSGSSGSAPESINEIAFKYKQALGIISTGDESIILEAQCQEEQSCEVVGMIYGNDSGPLPLIKMNFTGSLTWNGTHYSGVIIPQSSCAFVYELSIREGQVILSYDGRIKTFNSLSSFTGDITAQYSALTGAPQNCVDVR